MHSRTAKGFVDPQNRLSKHKTPDVEPIHPVDRHVGQQLRLRRMHSNLSQSDLGHAIGLSYQQIQKYETGKNRISASMLYELAGRLNVPVTGFFEGLPQSGAETQSDIVPGVDARLAYIMSAEGRRFVEEILRLPPRLRTRTFALIKMLAGDDRESDH